MDSNRARDLMTDANFDVVEALDDFARERGVALLDVAIGWLTAQPQVTSVIAGATTPEQVAANARAARWTPTERGPRGDRPDHPPGRRRLSVADAIERADREARLTAAHLPHEVRRL